MRGIDANILDGRVVYYFSLGVRWHRERQHRNNAGNAQECETIQYTRWEKSVFHSFLLMDIQIVYENEFFENNEVIRSHGEGNPLACACGMRGPSPYGHPPVGAVSNRALW